MQRREFIGAITATAEPLAGPEVAALLARTKRAAMTGAFERFKTTNAFDGTAKNPSWLGEHDNGPG